MRAASSDTEICLNYIGIHTHEAYWDEPEKFDPNRFLKDNNRKIVKNSHLNFGSGIRICPGRHWAMKNMKMLFVRLLTEFEVSLVNLDAPLKVEYNSGSLY